MEGQPRYLERRSFLALVSQLLLVGSKETQAVAEENFEWLVVERRVPPSGKVQRIKMMSGSMGHTLQIGDLLWVEVSIEPRRLQRGDILLFLPPAETKMSQKFVKRVVALAGDSVEVRQGRLVVNGKFFEEPYILEPMAYTVPTRVVPADHLFVLGDMRNNSYDSHLWGYLPQQNVRGRVFGHRPAVTSDEADGHAV